MLKIRKEFSHGLEDESPYLEEDGFPPKFILCSAEERE
jgi:hypothetical protein